MKNELRYILDNVIWLSFLIIWVHGLQTLTELEMYVHALQTLIIGMGIFSINCTISRFKDEELPEKTKNFLWLISIVIGVIIALIIFNGSIPIEPEKMISV